MIDNSLFWAIVVIVVVPLAVLGAAEFDERLRQRDSPLRSAMSIVRTWALPAFAVWAVLRPVLGRTEDSARCPARVDGIGRRARSSASSGTRVRHRGHCHTRARRRSRPGSAAAARIAAYRRDRRAALAAPHQRVGSRPLGAPRRTRCDLARRVVRPAGHPERAGIGISSCSATNRSSRANGSPAATIEGLVVDLNWRTTRIRTRNGDMVVIPNSQLAAANIVNYSAPEPLHRIVVSLQVAFANPPTLAKEMLLAAARETAGRPRRSAPIRPGRDDRRSVDGLRGRPVGQRLRLGPSHSQRFRIAGLVSVPPSRCSPAEPGTGSVHPRRGGRSRGRQADAGGDSRRVADVPAPGLARRRRTRSARPRLAAGAVRRR